MEKAISKLLGLGTAGLILIFMVSVSGFAGAAAITTALAALGGPFGMYGGIAALTFTALVASSIAKYGFENFAKQYVIALIINRNMSKSQIMDEINRFPLISRDLKNKIIKFVTDVFDSTNRNDE